MVQGRPLRAAPSAGAAGRANTPVPLPQTAGQLKLFVSHQTMGRRVEPAIVSPGLIFF